MGHEATTWKQAARYESMLGLLSFIADDYPAAKKHARTGYLYAKNGHLQRTLPAFLIAASSLYDENVQLN